MHIINVPQEWAMSATGGALVGCSTLVFFIFSGRLSGISGICKGTLTEATIYLHQLSKGELSKHQDLLTNIAYMIGLSASGYVLNFTLPTSYAFGDDDQQLSSLGSVVAGLLVGVGTKMANGCTSGHGLAGLSRFSPRSLVAVLTFMSTGVLTAYLKRAMPTLFSCMTSVGESTYWPLMGNLGLVKIFLSSLGGSVALSYLVGRHGATSMKRSTEMKNNNNGNDTSNVYRSFVFFSTGILCGCGLGLSGMTNPQKVNAFLDFSRQEGWDISLMGVMAAGMAVNTAAFQYIKQQYNEQESTKANLCVVFSDKNKAGDKTPLASLLKFGSCKENMKIDTQLVLGSALFGMGWGLAGICPGPGIVNLGRSLFPMGDANGVITASSSLAVLWSSAMVIGMTVADLIL